MIRSLATLPLLMLGSAATPTQVDQVARAGEVMAGASDFKALLIAILVLMALLVVPLVGLLGYLVVRFTASSVKQAEGMTAMAATLSRLESTVSAALSRMDDTLQVGLSKVEIAARRGAQ